MGSRDFPGMGTAQEEKEAQNNKSDLSFLTLLYPNSSKWQIWSTKRCAWTSLKKCKMFPDSTYPSWPDLTVCILKPTQQNNMTELSLKCFIVSLMSVTSNSCKNSFFNADKPFDRDTIIKEFNLTGMVLPRSKHDCVKMILKRRVYPTFIMEDNRCKSAELHKTYVLRSRWLRWILMILNV